MQHIHPIQRHHYGAWLTEARISLQGREQLLGLDVTWKPLHPLQDQPGRTLFRDQLLSSSRIAGPDRGGLPRLQGAPDREGVEATNPTGHGPLAGNPPPPLRALQYRENHGQRSQSRFSCRSKGRGVDFRCVLERSSTVSGDKSAALASGSQIPSPTRAPKGVPFRGFHAPASLKPFLRPDLRDPRSRFPGLSRPGLIEASILARRLALPRPLSGAFTPRPH